MTAILDALVFAQSVWRNEMAKISKISIATINESPVTYGVPPQGVSMDEGVEIRELLIRDGDPIHTRFFRVPKGQRVNWNGPSLGCGIYILSGTVLINDEAVKQGSAFIVERDAHASLTADPSSDVTFVEFRSPAHACSRAGGNVHIHPRESAPQAADLGYGGGVAGVTLFADSTCPTCELWLHEGNVLTANYESPLHSHSEDEVIFVIGGEMVLGRRAYGPGTAVAIAKNTVYNFKTGMDGLTFINFRPCAPNFITRDGSVVVDEREDILTRIEAAKNHSGKLLSGIEAGF